MTKEIQTIPVPIDIPEMKIAVEENSIHPHLLASLIVGALILMVGAIGVLGTIYGFLSDGGIFAAFVGLYFLVAIQVMLLLSRPMPYEIEHYKRQR